MCPAGANGFGGRELCFSCYLRRCFLLALSQLKYSLPAPARWKRSLLPNLWDQTFDFCHKEMLFNEIKEEKAHSSHLSESQTPEWKSGDPASETGSCFLLGCFLADHTILFPLIKGPVSLIESRRVFHGLSTIWRQPVHLCLCCQHKQHALLGSSFFISRERNTFYNSLCQRKQAKRPL